MTLQKKETGTFREEDEPAAHSEVLFLERVLRKLWDGHVLVLHFSKQLHHHG